MHEDMQDADAEASVIHALTAYDVGVDWDYVIARAEEEMVSGDEMDEDDDDVSDEDEFSDEDKMRDAKEDKRPRVDEKERE
jgi:hypothetical protein